MPYEVTFRPAAARMLSALPDDIKLRLASAVESLKTEPRPPGVKKLKGEENLWRIREGNYRILYSLDDKTKRLRILTIAHRRDVYRNY